MTGLKNELWFTFAFSNNRTKSNTNIFYGNLNSYFLWLGQKDVWSIIVSYYRQVKQYTKKKLDKSL